MNTNKKQLVLFSLLIDLFILNGCILILTRFYPGIRSLSFQQFLSLFLVLNVSLILAFTHLNKKSFYLRMDFLCRLEKIGLKFLGYFIISCILVLIFLPGYHLTFFFNHSALFLIVITTIYWLIYKYFIFKRAVEFNIQRVAIISKSKIGLIIKEIIKSNPSMGYKFVGFLIKDKSKPENEVLGSLLDLDEIIQKHHIQSIISVQNFDQSLVSTCDKHGVRLGIVPKNDSYYLNKSKYTRGIEVLRIHEIPLDNNISRIFKRLFDLFFSLSVIVCLLSWLMPVMALIIKFTSRGPVFFTQKRTGIYNSTFTCLKFRSMIVNNLSDVKQASKNDCRITAVGNFMRKTNIDELPQFFNVLLGQMSVVGPRPHMLKHTQYYSKMIENYLMRHYVKPGVTGWAQVNGLHGETDELWKMEKRVEYDLSYIANWSLWWDLKIILHTLFLLKRPEAATTLKTVPAKITAVKIRSGNIIKEARLQEKKNIEQVKEPAY